MTASIILAAGASTRMGRLKQLLPFGKTTILGAVVDNVRQAGIGKIVVVLGHESKQVRASFGQQCPPDIDFVVNPDHGLGMFSSVQAGLRAIDQGTDRFCICLGDQPTIQPATIRALADMFAASDKGIGIPVALNDSGHPLFVAGRYRPELVAMNPARSLKAFLAAHQDDIARLQTDDAAILRDIDTPADYEIAKNISRPYP